MQSTIDDVIAELERFKPGSVVLRNFLDWRDRSPRRRDGDDDVSCAGVDSVAGTPGVRRVSAA